MYCQSYNRKTKKQCSRLAKYRAKTIFGDVYYCHQHMIDNRGSLCVGIFEEIKEIKR